MRDETETGADPRNPRPGSWLSRNVLILGAVSLLNDTATEMALPLLPVFLTGTLGAGALALGVVEGLADAVASVLKLFSGRWADRLGRNRPFIVLGYALSSVVRPFLGLAGSAWHVLGIRVADRVGKGVRTTPRDALIAQSVRPEERGAAFGLHRAMDHAGAVLGPLLAAAILAYVTRDLRLIFWLTAIPGAAVLLVVWLGVDDPGGVLATQHREPRPHVPDTPGTGWHLSRFLVPLGLFTLGRASDVFLLLKAGATRTPLVALPLLWMGLHIVKALTSIPGGRLSDRFGRRRVIGAGWLFYAAVYAGFAYAETPGSIWALFLVYGLYHGLTEGAEKALIAELAPPRREGATFGWYHFTLGGMSLAASLLFGALWDLASPRTAFLTSAAMAVVAVISLLALSLPRMRES